MGVSRNPPLSGRSSLGCFPAVSLRALNAPLGPPLFRFPAVTFSKRFEGVWRTPAVTNFGTTGHHLALVVSGGLPWAFRRAFSE